jgi:hypothetical protein
MSLFTEGDLHHLVYISLAIYSLHIFSDLIASLARLPWHLLDSCGLYCVDVGQALVCVCLQVVEPNKVLPSSQDIVNPGPGLWEEGLHEPCSVAWVGPGGQ